MLKKMSNVRFLTVNAMLSAMCAILAMVAISTNNFKITFESFPILIGALTYGPVSGLLIGGIGTFIYQMLYYGFTLTTALWIMPYIVGGFITGWYAQKKKFDLSTRETVFILLVNELCITILNTVAIYVDSHIYGYYYSAIITSMIVIRLVVAIAKAFIFSAVFLLLRERIKSLILKNKA